MSRCVALGGRGRDSHVAPPTNYLCFHDKGPKKVETFCGLAVTQNVFLYKILHI